MRNDCLSRAANTGPVGATGVVLHIAREEAGTLASISESRNIAFASKLAPTSPVFAARQRGVSTTWALLQIFAFLPQTCRSQRNDCLSRAANTDPVGASLLAKAAFQAINNSRNNGLFKTIEFPTGPVFTARRRRSSLTRAQCHR